MEGKRTVALVALLLCPGSRAAAMQQTAPARPGVTAGTARQPVRLDGVLDEESWSAAGLIPDLSQQSPHPGEPTPYRTEVRLLADQRAIYVGVKAFDPQPDRIAAHTMQRDGAMDGDDTIALVVDTFDDQRTGFLFRVNAAGARQDGLISGAQELSLDWDGIWDARTRRTAEGWSAEIEIPAQTLRFDRHRPRWGLNVERHVARDRLTLRWAGISLDRALEDLNGAGELAGVEELRQGLGLSAAPYALTRWRREETPADHTTQGDAGFDLTWRFTPGLAGVLTVNTDFAETEVDTQQINLTRFDLFFPEKRAFFLEGANQFQFGSGLDTDFIPFYSRRIGLVEKDGSTIQVPIDAGVKLLGHAGRWGIGAVDARTGAADGIDATNLFAGRVTYDAGQRTRLGALFTHGDPTGSAGNALGGLDLVWHTTTFLGERSLTAGAWGARAAGELPDGSPSGWGFRAAYPNDRWDLSASVNQFGAALQSDLGFLPRPGTRFYDAGAAFQPRPDPESSLGWIRQAYFECFARRVVNLEGFVESWRVFTAPFNIETRNGEHFEANWAPEFQHLAEDAGIAGVAIPAGSYRFDRFRVEGQSSSHRPWRVGSTLWFGGFYDGHLSQLSQFLWWTTPGSHLQLKLERETDAGHLPAGRIAQRLWQFTLVYALTPRLVVSSYAQYGTDTLGINNRLRWTIHPGTDLFVVWNRDWEDPKIEDPAPPPPPPRSDFLPQRSDQLVVKLRWALSG